MGLMTTLPTIAKGIPPSIYGFQIILGLGFGLSLSCLVIVAQTEVRREEDVGEKQNLANDIYVVS